MGTPSAASILSFQNNGGIAAANLLAVSGQNPSTAVSGVGIPGLNISMPTLNVPSTPGTVNNRLIAKNIPSFVNEELLKEFITPFGELSYLDLEMDADGPFSGTAIFEFA